MALMINGSRIRSGHGYVRAFSGGFGGLRGFGGIAENELLQAVLNRYAAKVKLTPLVVDGVIGDKTKTMARATGDWLVANIADVNEQDYIQILRSRDAARLGAEASRLAGLLDGVANTMGLPTTVSAGTPSTPSSVFTPLQPSSSGGSVGRTSGTVITADPAPTSAGPAPTSNRSLYAAGVTVLALGLVLLAGEGGKRKRRR